MALKYTRVKDKDTGHEYDVLAHKFDKTKHERVTRAHWPDSPYPRAAKPNVKGMRADADDSAPAGGDSVESGEPAEAADSVEDAARPKRTRAPKTTTDQDAAGA